MSLCQKCGKQIPDNSPVCQFCGAAQTPGTSQPGVPNLLKPDSAPRPEGPRAPQTFGGPQPPQGGPRPPQGGPQPPFGGPQPPFGGPQPPRGGPQPPFGGPQPPRGGPQPPFGGPQPPFGGPQHPQGQYGYPNSPYPMYPPGTISPRNRDVVILLNFFAGALGAHRFYLGKYVSAVFMALTFGGLGIWAIIDCFISVFGNYTDGEGRSVDKRYTKGVVIFVFVLMGVWILFAGLYVIGMLALGMSGRY